MSAPRLIELATRVAEIDTTTCAGCSDEVLVSALREVGELRRLVDAAGARLAGHLGERCEPRSDDSPAARHGFASAADLVAATAGIDRAEAGRFLRVGDAVAVRTSLIGETLPAPHPVVAETLERGTLSVAAADRIASTLIRVAALLPEEQRQTLESTLVGLAPELTVRQFAVLCARVIDTADPDGVEPSDEDLRRRSSVTVTQQHDGLTRIVALLHPEAAAFVTTALDARTAPRRTPTFTDDTFASDTDPLTGEVPTLDPPADTRPLAQRRVDALAGIARDALTLDTGQVAGAPVTVQVIMTLEQLQGANGAAHLVGIDRAIPASVARRLAAGAEIIPQVLGGESEILDQGRRCRLATPAQRRALALRDQGCFWSGCPAPPGWCEVAHLVAWQHGGPTDLTNLALMCPFHHRTFDRDGWSVRWNGSTPTLIPPAHIDPTRTPRRAGPLPHLPTPR